MTQSRSAEQKEVVHWSQENQDCVRRYIQKSMQLLALGENGSVSTGRCFELDVSVRLLQQKICIHPIFSPLEKQGIIRKAIYELKRSNVQDEQQFSRLLTDMVGQKLANPIQKRTVLFLLNCDTNQFRNVRCITILGFTLLFRD